MKSKLEKRLEKTASMARTIGLANKLVRANIPKLPKLPKIKPLKSVGNSPLKANAVSASNLPKIKPIMVSKAWKSRYAK